MVSCLTCKCCCGEKKESKGKNTDWSKIKYPNLIELSVDSSYKSVIELSYLSGYFVKIENQLANNLNSNTDSSMYDSMICYSLVFF